MCSRCSFFTSPARPSARWPPREGWWRGRGFWWRGPWRPRARQWAGPGARGEAHEPWADFQAQAVRVGLVAKGSFVKTTRFLLTPRQPYCMKSALKSTSSSACCPACSGAIPLCADTPPTASALPARGAAGVGGHLRLPTRRDGRLLTAAAPPSQDGRRLMRGAVLERTLPRRHGFRGPSTPWDGGSCTGGRLLLGRCEESARECWPIGAWPSEDGALTPWGKPESHDSTALDTSAA